MVKRQGESHRRGLTRNTTGTDVAPTNFGCSADESRAGRYSGQQTDTIRRRLMSVVSTV